MMVEEDKNSSFDILALQEAERRRIAEDLHDTTVQELVALSQQLELVNLYFDKDQVQARLELISAKKQIKDIINGIRNTIYDLRPMSFDDFGWEASIERLYRETKDKNDMSVIFDIEKIQNIDKVIEITIYRIMREAIYNVCKHAMATELKVCLHNEGNYIMLKIQDNGIGIPEYTKENHFGMQFMQEKVKLLNGCMKIDTGEEGTTVLFKIPYHG